MAAREVIMEGSRWRVGNGRQIRAESHNWLSHKPIFRREECPNLWVGDLIDDRAWEWKRTLLAEIFAPRTCEEILASPLSRERTQDTLIWKENRKHKCCTTAKKVGSNGTLIGRGGWEAVGNSMETQCPTKGPNVYVESLCGYPANS